MQLLNTPNTRVFPGLRIVDRGTGCYLETSACQYVITIQCAVRRFQQESNIEFDARIGVYRLPVVCR
jgi:hypothetical protein